LPCPSFLSPVDFEETFERLFPVFHLFFLHHVFAFGVSDPSQGQDGLDEGYVCRGGQSNAPSITIRYVDSEIRALDLGAATSIEG
jgi:hypothetical protein